MLTFEPRASAERWRALRTVAGIGVRAAPLRTAAECGVVLLLEALVAVTAVTLKLLVDAVVAGDSQSAVMAGLGLAAITASVRVARWAEMGIRLVLRERTSLLIDTLLAESSATVAGLQFFERPESLDRLELIRRDHQALASIADLIPVITALVIRLITTAVLLGRIRSALVFLPLFAFPAVLLARRAEHIRKTAQAQIASRQRFQEQILKIATSVTSAKEIRVYEAQPLLLSRFDAAVSSANTIEARARMKMAISAVLGWLIFGTAYVGGLAFVANAAIVGRASAGDIVLAFTLAAHVNVGVSVLVGVMTSLWHKLGLAQHMVWLRDQAVSESRGRRETPPEVSSQLNGEVGEVPVPSGAVSPPEGPARPLSPLPTRLTSGISIENVSFRYPGTAQYVLRNIDLFLPAGATVAIVGENGAGKTTLVKLLLGFYEPTEGRIRVDGDDLRDLSGAEWLSRVAGAFQDFVAFEFAAQEVVGIGDLPRMDNHASVLRALDRSQARRVVETLPAGLDTCLGRSLDGGVDLSTGQWQRLALARAFMRDCPLLFVLDEPTSSLDAMAEKALVEHYEGKVFSVTRSQGTISIVVSHRFGVVIGSDLVVVLANGRLVEFGKHEELLASGQTYAELYEIQARAYR